MWEFRYYETSPVGKRIRQSVILGDQALYRTEADARKTTQALLMRLNDEAPRAEMEAPTFGALLDRTSSMSCQSDTRLRGRISRTFGNTSGRVGAINR